MKFTKQHSGKWVAVKNERVIASDPSYENLRNRLKNRPDRTTISVDLIPKGYLTGAL